ncbi:MAG TPA: polyamine aminopropyltransferase [Verrucomicrobiae bacterium]|nr:polyamine aminopropyltransferase [Verrucomicrobiae bacterium]
MTDRRIKFLLLASVFAIATCGLIYELIAGTLASYLLGDSVTQFSTIIGTYLFAMGIGSYLSKFINKNAVAVFIQVELIIGLVGGCSAGLLFLLFAEVDSFRVLLYAIVTIIGTLVGLEIPLLLRILKGRFEFKELVSQVFTFDYIGALLASLLFPLVLVPHLGLVRSSFLFGGLNVIVAMTTLHLLRKHVAWARSLFSAGVVIFVALTVGFIYSERLLAWSEKTAYVDTVIFARSTPYQRIVITREAEDLRLYLNGNLQFSSRDEYRYHEALVHPGLARLAQPHDVLVLGGGDGIAVRELLKYPSITNVVLVDLDPEMTHLFSTQEMLLKINESALLSPRVHVKNGDAFTWLKSNTNQFDYIVADFPDPSNFSLGKLFTTAFYERVKPALRPHGAMVVQCTSPWVARKSFWCVDETLRASGFVTEPYHLYVPSFGEWGFILASHEPLPQALHLPEGLKFVSDASTRDMFHFPPDMGPVQVEANRLNNQMLVRYFEEEWAHYVH